MVLVFLTGAALLVATALLAGCLFRLSVPGTVLAGYLVAVAEVVLVSEALSAVHGIGRTGYLAAEAPLFVLALALWLRAGRPRPGVPVRLEALRRHPVLIALALLVGLAIAYQAWVALVVPPNTWDAMTYHLARAAAWLQLGAIEWHPSPTALQNTFPPNGEIQFLWTLALAGRDTFAALPQLAAELVTMVAVFGTSRRLGFGRAPAAFAALIFATLSEVALEATSTQNDLLVTAPAAAAVYFLLGRSRREIGLAALAIALALGTKLTALIALPALVLLAIGVLPRRRLLELAVASAIAFAAFGAYGYADNLIHTGTVLGDNPETAAMKPVLTVRGTVSTSARVLWRFVDLSGSGVPQSRVTVAIGDAGKAAFGALGIARNPPEATLAPFSFAPNTQPDEDFAYFGPLGALLLLPAVGLFLLAGLARRASRERFLVALALPIYVVVFALAYRYNAWTGRLMVLPVALAMPLVARVYQSWRLVAACAVVVAAFFLPITELHDVLKPVSAAAGGVSRIDAETMHFTALRPALDLVAARVPQNARLGYSLSLGNGDDWTYPLYGPHFTRKLDQLPVQHTLAAARAQELDWVVVDRVQSGGDGFTATVAGPWTLLHRSPHPTLPGAGAS